MAAPAATAGSFTAGAIKTLTGHMEGTAGLAGLLLGQVALSQRFTHGMRYRSAAAPLETCKCLCLLAGAWHPLLLVLGACRSANPYVANSFGGWAVPHRLPIQGGPAAASNAGTSSFGMSGINAHAIITTASEFSGSSAASASSLPVLSLQRNLRCFVDVLAPLHPLLGSATKASGVLHPKLLHMHMRVV